jgi:hypothetical protein
MDSSELRLEVLRMVLECGSENIKSNPLPTADNYYNWISMGNESSPKKRKTISKKDLSDSKE